MANQEHLNILKQGVEAWNQWRKEHPDIRADLRDANLRGANLRGANLTRATLYNADLTGADLTGADIRDANFTGANLSFATLFTVHFRDADLTGADLTEANFSKWGAFVFFSYAHRDKRLRDELEGPSEQFEVPWTYRYVV